MSIARRRNTEKRSVRTLIAIATLAPIVFGGARQPRGEVLSSCSSCASWPSCFRQKKRAVHIKVLTDLSLLCLLMSIDIKVFQTFAPHAREVPSCKSWPSWPSCFRQLNAREGLSLALRPPPTLGYRSVRTLMSIERGCNKEKRSVRTLMFIASEAGWPGLTGWPG